MRAIRSAFSVVHFCARREDPGTAVEAERLPVGLRGAGALDGGGDVGRGLLGDAADDLAGRRVLDLEALGAPPLVSGFVAS